MRSSAPESPRKKPHSFGRRRGRSPTRHQTSLYRRARGKVILTIGTEREDIRQRFRHPEAPLHLEIGFGGGEYLFARAQQNPGVNYLGIEPYQNGVAKLLSAMASAWGSDNLAAGNIRLFDDDLHLFWPALADRSVARIDLLFPDPWPKKRHHRRRLVNPSLLSGLARVATPNALLHIATDHSGYLEHILSETRRHPDWQWQIGARPDWHRPFEGITTRYAQKASIAGRRCYYLKFSVQPAFSDCIARPFLRQTTR